MELRAVRADISIHPPHAGRDLEAFDAEPEKPLFQSTRPMRGGTRWRRRGNGGAAISIHPPHAGRDAGKRAAQIFCQISIPPPHAGRDAVASETAPEEPRFQSTRPMRGGTIVLGDEFSVQIFQSTRPMRGGTHLLHPELAEAIYFNPPAPCGAGLENFLGLGTLIIFQSTRPMRGGTRARAAPLICSKNFNPPAPCGAGRSRYPFFSSLSNFNPPAPCGAGQQSCTKFTPCILAQYTIQRAAKLLFAYQQAYFC